MKTLCRQTGPLSKSATFMALAPNPLIANRNGKNGRDKGQKQAGNRIRHQTASGLGSGSGTALRIACAQLDASTGFVALSSVGHCNAGAAAGVQPPGGTALAAYLPPPPRTAPFTGRCGAYATAWAPVISTSEPHMKAASSLARNATSAATSSGLPIRP